MTSDARTWDRSEQGFSLVELLVVMIILGVLAAIAVPRLLSQRQAAWDASAIADLRNLIAIETSLEDTTGLTEDAAELRAEGWDPSSEQIRACVDVIGGGVDMRLATWHVDGTTLYTWQRAEARIEATTAALPADCTGAIGGPGLTPTRVD